RRRIPVSRDAWVADPTARTGGVTPMMRQYRDLKQRYPDYLLLFRLGDFYELFLEDAELGARLLQITLTSRQGSPMAGIPHHAAEVYIARLIRAGQKVALCEQLEAPGKGKKLLKRDVVRLITPGTITDTAFLAGSANNFLLAVVRAREGTGGVRAPARGGRPLRSLRPDLARAVRRLGHDGRPPGRRSGARLCPGDSRRSARASHAARAAGQRRGDDPRPHGRADARADRHA